VKKSRLALCSVITILAVVSLLFFIGCNGSESLAGKLYVGGYNTEQIYVVDIEQKAIVKIIDLPTGVQPDWLTLSPDGKSLFLSANNQDQIHIIDTDTNCYKTSVDVCENPKGIAFTPDGSIAAVVQDDDISLIDVDALTYNYDTSDTIIGVRGIGGIAIHPILNVLYAPGKDVSSINQVYSSDIVGNATPVAYSILHPSLLNDVEITADGSRLFVSAVGQIDAMHFFDLNTSDGSIQSHISKDMLHVRGDNDYSGKMRLMPDNKRLYIGAYSSAMLDYIDLSNIDTRVSIDIVDYTNLGTGPTDIVFSAGSSYAFVLIDGMDDLIIILNTSDDSVIDTISLPNCDPRSIVYKP